MTEIMKRIIQHAVDGPLSEEDATCAFNEIMSGNVLEGQIAAFLTALKCRGEAVDEIKAAAQVMLNKCRKVLAPKTAIDIVGTGGDGKGTLNISTATALVVASCGVPVAKHGNKNISSQSGAADVLEHLGVKTMVEPHIVERSIKKANIGFMMAPIHHPAVKNVMPIRQMLGIRTIFNILGPLTNPANVKYHLIGAYDINLLTPMVTTLKQLGSKRAWLVHGHDGIDEISISSPTTIFELNDGEINSFEIKPSDAGLHTHALSSILGGSPTENARHLTALLNGEISAYRDAVLLNSAAALLIAGLTKNLKEGVAIATRAIDSGTAKNTLELLSESTKEI
jgi:anthranilate phosphoribosyltransferase